VNMKIKFIWGILYGQDFCQFLFHFEKYILGSQNETIIISNGDIHLSKNSDLKLQL
jgi:hypothetical protein